LTQKPHSLTLGVIVKTTFDIDCNMKIYFFIILTFSLTLNTMAQSHSFDTTLVINGHSFRILNTDINNESISMTVYRDSKKITIDTLESGGLAN
jgi:hypothetical protein